MACRVETESLWANGFICATIRLRYQRPEHALMLTLTGGSDLSRVKVPGFPVYEGRERAGCVTYVPTDAERQGWYRNVKLDLLILLIDPGLIRSCEFGPHALDLPSFINGHDPLLQSVLRSLAREMRDCGAGLPTIYAEHAAGLVMAHLVHSAGAAVQGIHLVPGSPKPVCAA
jgi:AraC family transcriptional regulator